MTKIFDIIDSNDKFDELKALLNRDIHQVLSLKDNTFHPLLYAARRGKWDCVAVMVDAIITKDDDYVNLMTFDDASEVLFLALRDDASVVPAILKLKYITATFIDQSENTALHWAVRYGYPEYVAELLAKKCSLSKNLSGLSPLDLAIDLNREKCLEVMAKHLRPSHQLFLADFMASSIYKVVKFGNVNIFKTFVDSNFVLTLDTYDSNGKRIPKKSKSNNGFLKSVGASLSNAFTSESDRLSKAPCTLFDVAVRNNHPYMLEALIAHHNNLIKQNKNGHSVMATLHEQFVKALFVSLQHANDLKNVECIRVIVKFIKSEPNCLAFINECSFSEKEPLLKAFLNAIITVNEIVVDEMLSISPSMARFLANAEINGTESLLHYFARQNNAIMVKKLLAAGARQTVSKLFRTPFQEALKSSAWDVARLIVADPNFARTNASQLGWCARELLKKNKLELAHDVLRLGGNIDIDAVTIQGDAIIHFAAQRSKFKLELLDEHHPNLHIKNRQGESPTQIAMFNLNFEFLTWIYRKDRSQMNLKQIFHLAVSSHQNDFVLMMLKDHPALCNEFDAEGNIFLTIAAKHGNYDLVRLLIENGANPLAKLNGGKHFGEYLRQYKNSENSQILNEIESKAIIKLSESTASDFLNLTLNQADHKNHADVVAKIIGESKELLYLVMRKLKGKIDLSPLDTEEERKLLKIYNKTASSHAPMMSDLRDLKIEADKFNLPEARYISEYIARLDTISIFRKSIEVLIDDFMHEVNSTVWYSKVLGVWVKKMPGHMSDLNENIPKIRSMLYAQGHYDLFETGPVMHIYNLIRDVLNKAKLEITDDRDPKTTEFYIRQSDKFNAATFTPINQASRAKHKMVDGFVMIDDDSASEKFEESEELAESAYADPLHASLKTEISPSVSTVTHSLYPTLSESNTIAIEMTAELLKQQHLDPLLATNSIKIKLSETQTEQVIPTSSVSTKPEQSASSVYADNKEVQTLYPFFAANLAAPMHAELYPAFYDMNSFVSTMTYTPPEPSAPRAEIFFAPSITGVYADNAALQTLYPFVETGLDVPSHTELYPAYFDSNPLMSHSDDMLPPATDDFTGHKVTASIDLISFGEDETVTAEGQAEVLVDLNFEAKYKVPTNFNFELFSEVEEESDTSTKKYRTGFFDEKAFDALIMENENPIEKPQSPLRAHSLLKSIREKPSKEKTKVADLRPTLA